MIILILVIAIILICAISGYRRGLFGIIFGICSWAFIFCAVVFGSPVMKGYLEKRTEIGDFFYSNTRNYVAEKLKHSVTGTLDALVKNEGDAAEGNSGSAASEGSGTASYVEPSGAASQEASGETVIDPSKLEERKNVDGDTASTPFIADLISRLVSDIDSSKNQAAADITASTGNGTIDSAFPPSMNREIRGAAQEAVEDYNGASADKKGRQTVFDFVADSVALKMKDYGLSAASKLFTFAIAGVICCIVGLILKVVQIDRGVRTKQHLFGVIFGVVEGLLIVWFLMYLVSCLGTTAVGRPLLESIDKNVILSWLYNSNPVAAILQRR